MEHTHAQGVFMRDFLAKLEGEDGKQFRFKGESDFDRNKGEIQGAWLQSLP